jgi:hypothetical protein
VRLVIVCVIASVMAVAGYALTVDGGAPWWTRGAWLALMMGAMLVAVSRHPLASRMVAFAARRGSPAA